MYMVFAGDTYYPNGGMSDHKGNFNNEDDAKTFIMNNSFDWWQICVGSEIINSGYGQ